MRIRNPRILLSILAIIPMARVAFAQPCLIGYTFTANPPPVGGQYTAGQNVQFCLDISFYDITVNSNWLHSVVPSFGPGWDLGTLVPGAPPPECGGSGGTWMWSNSVTGTSPFSVGTVGPGFFFDLDNNGDPGDNLGDNCTGPWQFCFTISVNSGFNCVNGDDLTVGVDTYSDSETGSWGSAGCGGDVIPSLAATALCCSANAGTDGAVVVCFTDPPFDLFNFLGNFPDAGGTWIDPFGNPIASVIDPQVSPSGNYTYTVAPPGCAPDQSLVNVTINVGANAGFDAVISVCDQGGGFTDLFANLFGADPGGFWTNPGGGFSNGFYNPAFDTPGIYTYTVPGQGNCPGDDATVTVTEVVAPNAGTSTAINICSNSGWTDLFILLGVADPGGSWTGPGGVPHSGLFDPIFDPPGLYTYTLFGAPPCLPASASINVSVNFPPQTGVVGAATFCTSDPIADLFLYFNGQAAPGGTWTDNNGNPFNGFLDPSQATSGVYMYILAGVAPCPDGQNPMTVTINPSPDPGFPGGLTVCGSDAPQDLFNSLLGTPDPGGSWADPLGAPFAGIFDPPTSMSGTYTYTVPANGLCLGGSATVDVVVVAPANAGTDNSTALCENEPNINLATLLGGSQAVNGSWTGPGGGASNGIVDPTLLDEGDYTYTVQGTAPCLDDFAIITVAIDTLPTPGTDNVIALCANAPPQDLFPLLGTADAGGTWTAPDGSPFSGIFNPDSMATGDYTYSVFGTGACTGEVFTAVVSATSYPLPSPVFAQDTTMGCMPLLISFELGDPTVTLSDWDFGDGATSAGVLDAAHTYEVPGIYDVTVTVLDDNGCTVTLTVDSAVQVHDLPDPLFFWAPDPAETLTPDVHFTTFVTDYPLYEWTIDGDSAGTGTPFDIHFSYFTPQVYEVCLTVTDTNQCTAEQCEDIVVRQELALYVPNAFSPDGNGVNEFFYPVILGAEMKDYEFTVFDRWGELVFASTEIGEAWNGGMDNGTEPLEPGVFTWRVRLRESAKAEREDIFGHVTLLK